MFEKFSRSWSLIKASASVLRSDKELLVFPLLSGISCVLVAATFFIPAITSGMFAGIDGEGTGIGFYLFLFAFYVVQHWIDPGYRFAGLIDFARYLLRRR